jgi:HSP20 family protein
MAIVPFRPSNDPLDRIFDSLLGTMGGSTHGGSLMRAPDTDVVETEDEIRVSSEMPGLHPDDIEIDVENNVLTLRAEKNEERTEGEEGGRYHLAERRFGVFSRSFVLPRDVDPDNIQADFRDGVLTVHIPKSEKSRRRRISIAGEGQDTGTQLHAGRSSREVGPGNAEPRSRGRSSVQDRNDEVRASGTGTRSSSSSSSSESSRSRSSSSRSSGTSSRGKRSSE